MWLYTIAKEPKFVINNKMKSDQIFEGKLQLVTPILNNLCIYIT